MSNRINLNPIIDVIKKAAPVSDKPVHLHMPCFTGNEWAYVRECLDSRWVSSAGNFVERFEKQLADFTGAKYVIAVVNGTAALHLSLKLLSLLPGDEVLVPALTFVATINAIHYCGAIPHFVDSEEKTLGMDPHKLEDYLREIAEIRSGACFNKLSGRPIRAVIPIHTFGHPVDMDPLADVCAQFKLELIEDAAESLGSLYKGEHTGKRGKLSVLSFNGNKIITTGGGGAIMTEDSALAHYAKHLSTQAKLPHSWAYNHDLVVYNYRMPSLNAALGCAQLEQLPDFIARKRTLAQRYQYAFAGIEGVAFFKEPDFARSNYWLNVLLLDETYTGQRDELLELSHREGIMTRPAWTLMHRLPMNEQCPHMDLKVAESLQQRIINIPSGVGLTRLLISNDGK